MAKTKKLIALLLAIVMITTLVSPSNYNWSNAAETRGGHNYATETDALAMLADAAITGSLEDYITGATISNGSTEIYGTTRTDRPANAPLPVDPNDPTKTAGDVRVLLDIVFPEELVKDIRDSGEDAVFRYTMPDTIKFNDDILNQDIKDKDGSVIGKYSVINEVLIALYRMVCSLMQTLVRGSILIFRNQMKRMKWKINFQVRWQSQHLLILNQILMLLKLHLKVG